MDRTTERESIQPGILRKMEKFGVKVHVSPSFGSKLMPQPSSPFSLSLCCVDTQRNKFSGFF